MSSACSCGWTSRLYRPLFLWWAAALAVQLAADFLLKYANPRPPISFLAAFLPALLWIIVIGEFVRAVLKLDEFQQRLHLQAIAIACLPIAVLAVVFSALRRAEIYRPPWELLGSLFVLALVASYGFLAWRYR